MNLSNNGTNGAYPTNQPNESVGESDLIMINTEDKPRKVLVTLTPEQAEVLEARAKEECRTLSNMVQYLIMRGERLDEASRQVS